MSVLVAQRLRPHRLARATVPVLARASPCWSVLALGVPVGSSVYWMFEGGAHAHHRVSLLARRPGTRAGYGIGAAALATVLALPVALLAVRHGSGPGAHVLERSTYLVLAMPGVVVAFAFRYFTEHYCGGFGYQTAPLLILCYAIMFFPLALVGVKASLARPRPAWTRWPAPWASAGSPSCCG